jgi:WD40 repeat protein
VSSRCSGIGLPLIGVRAKTDPFAQDYPETIDHTYETTAQRCRFNDVQGPWAGNLLATGGQDGVVEVWDMEMTNGALVRMFDGHVKAVESLR